MGDKEFFKVAAWYHWLWIVPSLTLGGIMVFSPELLPYDSLSVLGDLLRYVAYDQPLFLKIVFTAVMVAHVVEGCYGYVLSRRLKLITRDTILWTVQTTIMGFTSHLLLKEELEKEKQR